VAEGEWKMRICHVGYEKGTETVGKSVFRTFRPTRIHYKGNKKSSSAEVALDYIRKLYAPEKAGRQQGLSLPEPFAFRREKAERILRMKVSVAQLSFARALTESRLLFKLLVSAADVDLWPPIWAEFVADCARHRVNSKPGRQFPRDRQEYRRKSCGLEKHRPGRRPKNKKATRLPPGPETRKDSKGNTYLLS
jgi:hypothetical protein